MLQSLAMTELRREEERFRSKASRSAAGAARETDMPRNPRPACGGIHR
jgi:hypothetical protein